MRRKRRVRSETARVLAELYETDAGAYTDYLYESGYSGQRLLSVLQQVYPAARLQSLQALQQRVIDARQEARDANALPYDTPIDPRCAVLNGQQTDKYRYIASVTWHERSGESHTNPYVPVESDSPLSMRDLETQAFATFSVLRSRARRRGSDSGNVLPRDLASVDVKVRFITCKE